MANKRGGITSFQKTFDKQLIFLILTDFFKVKNKTNISLFLVLKKVKKLVLFLRLHILYVGFRSKAMTNCNIFNFIEIRTFN